MSMSLASKKLSSAASNDDDGKELWLEVSSDTTIERGQHIFVCSAVFKDQRRVHDICALALYITPIE